MKRGVSQITIGGVPGAGKSTAARSLAEVLGFSFWSGGGIRREMASRRGLTIEEFNALDENTDEELDSFQKNELRYKDSFVFEGRLGFLFIPESFKIYFHCDLDVAASRVFNDPRSSENSYHSVEAVKNGLLGRMNSDRDRYSRYYGVDCYSPEHFDYVIDTTNMTKEEVVSELLQVIRERCF